MEFLDKRELQDFGSTKDFLLMRANIKKIFKKYLDNNPNCCAHVECCKNARTDFALLSLDSIIQIKQTKFFNKYLMRSFTIGQNPIRKVYTIFWSY